MTLFRSFLGHFSAESRKMAPLGRFFAGREKSHEGPQPLAADENSCLSFRPFFFFFFCDRRSHTLKFKVKTLNLKSAIFDRRPQTMGSFSRSKTADYKSRGIGISRSKTAVDYRRQNGRLQAETLDRQSQTLRHAEKHKTLCQSAISTKNGKKPKNPRLAQSPSFT